MRKHFFALAALMMALAPAVFAQRSDDPAKPEAEKTAESTPALSFSPGLFGVAQHENDWYFEIPDSLLGRRILSVTRYVSNTPGAGQYGGEEVTEHMIYWEKASNGNLLLRVDALTITADEDQEIYKAVKVSSENPIVASFKPEKNSPDGATRIKVTSLFAGDNEVFAFSSRGKRQYNLGGTKGDASFIESIRTYPINTEVTVTKTYSYNAPAPSPGQMPSRGLPAGAEAGVVTFVLNTSMVLLPEVPMQPRLVDPRVGYFADERLM